MTLVPPRRAMVLCAGLGERMRPITDTLPKPLVEVAGRSLLDHVLDRLEAVDVVEVVINLHYLGHMIEAHLAQRAALKIVYSPEDTLLETGGGVKQALPLLGDEAFYVATVTCYGSMAARQPCCAWQRLGTRRAWTRFCCCIPLPPRWAMTAAVTS